MSTFSGCAISAVRNAAESSARSPVGQDHAVYVAVERRPSNQAWFEGPASGIAAALVGLATGAGCRASEGWRQEQLTRSGATVSLALTRMAT
jgi:hypothetical protein